MRSAVGAFCFGTNFVERRRLRFVEEVFFVGVVWVVLPEELEEPLVCFLVAARLAQTGAQSVRHSKTKR